MPERFSVTMWDFTWLTRRFSDEAEYADFNRVLDGLAERGYECIRLDPFPHFLDYLERNPGRPDAFTVLPQTYSKQWGNSRPVTTDVRRPLVSFLGKCRERGFRVGLSTWFTPDTLDLRAQIRTPGDYVRAWSTTLHFIAREGFSDMVSWVDLCNEFPFPGWAYGAFPAMFRSGTWNSPAYFLPWSRKTVAAVQRYVDGTIPVLKREFGHRFTFSCMCMARKEHLMDVSHLDILEPHLWLTDLPGFGLPSFGLPSTAQVPLANRAHARAASLLYPPLRGRWLRMMERYMDRIAAWALDEGKPLITTEGWASTMYGGGRLNGRDAAWAWIKDACHAAVHLALAKGWTGICTSNFCQPHFPAMWKDLAWHRGLTDAIRARCTPPPRR